MDVRKVAKLIQLIDESNLDEIEIESKDERILLRRNPPVVAPVQMPAQTPQPAPAAPAITEAPTTSETNAKEPEEEQGTPITSPIVGTYYEAASPGAKPFIQIGSMVREGDVVCIVEAMKMMNNIKAPSSGVVKAITVNNGQPVEYGQPLIYLGDI